MHINETSPVGGSATTKKKKPQGTAGNFSALLDAGAVETSAAEAASPLAPVAGLFVVQGTDTGEAIARETKRGYTMLDLLDEMRAGLLDGRMNPQTIQKLMKEIKDTPDIRPDPALNAVIDEISLRAEVELAKLEKQGEC